MTATTPTPPPAQMARPSAAQAAPPPPAEAAPPDAKSVAPPPPGGTLPDAPPDPPPLKARAGPTLPSNLLPQGMAVQLAFGNSAGITSQVVNAVNGIKANVVNGPAGFVTVTGKFTVTYERKVEGMPPIKIEGYVGEDARFYDKYGRDSTISLIAGGTLSMGGIGFTIEHDAHFGRGGDPAAGKPDVPATSMQPIAQINNITVSATTGEKKVGNHLFISASGSITRAFVNREAPAFDSFLFKVGLSARVPLANRFQASVTARGQLQAFTDGHATGAKAGSPNLRREDGTIRIGGRISRPLPGVPGANVYAGGEFTHVRSIPAPGRGDNRGEGVVGVTFDGQVKGTK